ncbi:hypothetical protein SH1V18_10940 [Vallitalea longa]|uniref:Uncharacterized protein n=1 Tax=Vallitalea longa TaxID=2936439 RepID=A0A9W5YAY0_9FIRM|nr:hypothetical protein [Vallitalea longa]GKX28614.1 hypothetical protein SH1V18_10940 [Vallitalea longa]
MINELREILNKPEYDIRKVNDRIMICYGNSNFYPEDYIEIKIYENDYEVCEIHKDITRTGVRTNKKDDVIVLTIVLCKRLYESDGGDIKIARTIRKLVNEEKIKEGIVLLKENLTEDNYSLTSEEKDKVCLIINENKCNVKFHGKNLVENAKLSRGFVALYNYSRSLMEITAIYNLLSLNFNFSYEKKELEDIYIFGI